MILISNLILSVEDGSTIASTEIYGADKKTYINIGSGNVFKLSWTTPTLTNDTVDRYSLVIKRYDPTSNLYYNIFDENIGVVNYFSVNSDILPLAPDQYLLSIYVVAYGQYGSVVTSNVVNPYVCRASGTYVKTTAGYMKRALGFVNTAADDKNMASQAPAVEQIVIADSDGNILVDANGATLEMASQAPAVEQIVIADSDGNILVDANGATLVLAETGILDADVLLDINGEPLISTSDTTLYAFATKLLESTSGWQLVREGYTKGADGEWHTNDIKYEALVLDDGIVEVLVNGVYEPLYTL